jgi:adenylate cyclase
MEDRRIRVFLADDSLIAREGIRALIESYPDLEVVGVASDYEELVEGGRRLAPDVVVTDIRMPPTFAHEGVDASREIRRGHPGTGIVVLSQYDDPDAAVTLLAGGAAGCAYLLKERVADGGRLAAAIRGVAAGGSVLDPAIVDGLVRPLGPAVDKAELGLLQEVAAGKSIKEIAASRQTTPAAAAAQVEQLFLTLARRAGYGEEAALGQLVRLHRTIAERKEQGDTLSRLLPGGLVAAGVNS